MGPSPPEGIRKALQVASCLLPQQGSQEARPRPPAHPSAPPQLPPPPQGCSGPTRLGHPQPSCFAWLSSDTASEPGLRPGFVICEMGAWVSEPHQGWEHCGEPPRVPDTPISVHCQGAHSTPHLHNPLHRCTSCFLLSVAPQAVGPKGASPQWVFHKRLSLRCSGHQAAFSRLWRTALPEMSSAVQAQESPWGAGQALGFNEVLRCGPTAGSQPLEEEARHLAFALSTGGPGQRESPHQNLPPSTLVSDSSLRNRKKAPPVV